MLVMCKKSNDKFDIYDTPAKIEIEGGDLAVTDSGGCTTHYLLDVDINAGALIDRMSAAPDISVFIIDVKDVEISDEEDARSDSIQSVMINCTDVLTNSLDEVIGKLDDISQVGDDIDDREVD